MLSAVAGKNIGSSGLREKPCSMAWEHFKALETGFESCLKVAFFRRSSGLANVVAVAVKIGSSGLQGSHAAWHGNTSKHLKLDSIHVSRGRL